MKLTVLPFLSLITTQRISPASACGGFYLTKQSEYNLRLFGQRFYESPLLVKSRALNRETGNYDDLDPDMTYRLGGINYILRNHGDGFAMLKDMNTVVNYVTEDYLMLSEYAKSFKKSSDGFAHITTENSPLSSYEGYLLDYEDPYGSGRIIIK